MHHYIVPLLTVVFNLIVIIALVIGCVCYKRAKERTSRIVTIRELDQQIATLVHLVVNGHVDAVDVSIVIQELTALSNRRSNSVFKDSREQLDYEIARKHNIVALLTRMRSTSAA